MNRSKALDILGIKESDQENVKRAYRILALRYHPDKNTGQDATIKFQEINDAYTYLNGSVQDDELPSDYKSLLRVFLRTWFKRESDDYNSVDDVLHEWLRRITTICEEKALSLIKNIDKHVLKTIYELLSMNSDVLHISDIFLEKMRDVLKTKFENDERIILHPFLDDIENLYKLTVGEKVYLVPLWHHHLVYDATDGKEIYVDCYPLLPESIWMDEYNNINIKIERDLIDIWTNSEMVVEYGSRFVCINKSQIQMVENQTITCIGKGILLPTNSFTNGHKENVKSANAEYGNSEKSNVYIHLTMHYNIG